MKRNQKSKIRRTALCALMACLMAVGAFTTGTIITRNTTAVAEASETEIAAAAPASDPSPAIYVSQKNINSVVGVLTYTQEWDRSSNDVEEQLYGQGSGVVIKEGGYILTNNHVVQAGNAYKVLMPSGEEVEASLVGQDSALDLAVLKVKEEYADQLTPVTIGSSENLVVGSTVIAIGNPGGEILANTVTQGIVSALERSSVYSSNTTRGVDYIQHDAAINSGNSGGGLFDYQGNLVGINTLKYSGSSYYSTSTYDGLGFAIPIDSAYPIAEQLIENGKVVRPQIGVTVAGYEGPDEPMENYAPASVCIYSVNADSPAEKAGLKQYDFIYSVNDERVTTYRELTAVLDKYQAGDTVTLTVVRYNNVSPVSSNSNDNYYSYGNNNSNSSNGGYSYSFPFGFNFGNGNNNYGYSYGNGSNDGSSENNNDSAQSTQSMVSDLNVGGGYEFVTVEVTLELPEETND